MDLKKIIRDIPDFPKEGIVFKDITTLLKDADAFKETIDQLVDRYKDYDFNYIAGIEARGFIFAAPLALAMGKGLIPIRKVGKLPGETITASYDLEYGSNAVEMHKDALKKGDKVLLVDDLLATGGTVAAAVDLIEELGAKVFSIAFLLELEFLNGREKLQGKEVFSLLKE
ncbi:adenine phosphoribosyltransferase [Natronospora cellulosivora (SeqCode)]